MPPETTEFFFVTIKEYVEVTREHRTKGAFPKSWVTFLCEVYVRPHYPNAKQGTILECSTLVLHEILVCETHDGSQTLALTSARVIVGNQGKHCLLNIVTGNMNSVKI